MKFIKYENNPILSPNPNNDWESLCVLNPAVIYSEEEKQFVMLYRAAGNDETHYIHIGLATSKDGINFTRAQDTPLISPSKNGEDGGGVEDPRLVKIGDYYYLTYASRPFAPGQYWLPHPGYYGFQPSNGPKVLIYNNTMTHLAVSRDLRSWKKLGRITNAKDDDRDVVIFPRSINGKYYRFSRPMDRFGKGYKNKKPAIWITSSSDLLEWDEPVELFFDGVEEWESKKVGISCPPIETKDGWLVMYHGVSNKDDAYRVGMFLLDLDNPRKILAKTKLPLMEPEFDYETKGYYNGCVFPTANVVRGDTIYIYYGAADHFIGLATCSLSTLLSELKKEPYHEI